ncbi:hypothetical protein [Asanoa iriomotensis]|uniref:Uncharacterized protein n=1 Tax=Asanoa iriomotensis TaxID=234613 RepID=A0ABQ4C4D1_9ACTN|nr:hypothetical protein [Asanoa iriomotensis]GIF57614.1 hypothetical protein Air01nite_37090 [Asanoa iriomotensis]
MSENTDDDTDRPDPDHGSDGRTRRQPSNAGRRRAELPPAWQRVRANQGRHLNSHDPTEP